jgi:hypothetical protein
MRERPFDLMQQHALGHSLSLFGVFPMFVPSLSW